MDDTISRVEDLATCHEYEGAIHLCQAALVTSSEGERGDWLLRIGQIRFLNNMGDSVAWHMQTVPNLKRAVELLPGSADALFWLGYAGVIIPSYGEQGYAALRSCLDLSPDHPYANLMLARGESDHLQRLPYLRRVVRTRPANQSAVKDLALCAQRAGFIREAVDSLERALSQPPYVETSCGIMNRYANNVFLEAKRDAEIRESCRALLTILRLDSR